MNQPSEAILIVDFTRYTPPGVYVEAQDNATLFVGVGIPTATVTVIGYGRGYQMHLQTVALTNETPETPPTPLAKKGILPDGDDDALPDLTVTTFAGEVLVEGEDYTLVRGTTPTVASAVTTIARNPSSDLAANGEVVTVSYAYTDQYYYSPKPFDDYGLVEQTYGEAMLSALPADGSSQVNSPIALAARIAFENGAGTVICLAVEPPVAESVGPPAVDEITYRDRFNQAYAKVAASYSHTMLVPVFESKSLGLDAEAYKGAFQGLVSDVRAHCEGESANGFGRIALVGGDTALDDEDQDDITHEEIATAIDSHRVVLAYPPRMNFFNAALGQATEIGGTYLAAAFAGRLAVNNPNRGLTQQPIYGFTGIPEALRVEMTAAAKNSLTASGVSVVELGRTSSLVCRHGVSTDFTSLVTREISLTRTTDLLYQLVAEGLIGSELVGDPIDEFMTTRVKGVVTSVLETATLDQIILEYTDVLVRQQSLPGGDPTVIECLFTYRPMLPLNYITVGFTMDLTSGEVTPAEELALV